MLFLLFSMSWSAAAEGRVALFVENGAYRVLPLLTDPANDTHAMAKALLEAGMEAPQQVAQAPAEPIAPRSGLFMDVCPNNYQDFPVDAEPLTCTCSAERVKTILESNPLNYWIYLEGYNPYTSKSDLCLAALHAGAVNAKGGQVVIIPAPAVRFFPGAPRNGIKSGGSKEGGDGFRIAAASQSLPLIKGEFSNSPPGSTIPRQAIAVLGLEEWLGINIMATDEGVRIASVTLDGPADTAGLQRNDVITQIDGQPVGTGDAARDAIINAVKAVKAEERSSIVFTVIRPDRPLKLTIKRAGEPPVTTR
jgi:hypothetical protein